MKNIKTVIDIVGKALASKTGRKVLAGICSALVSYLWYQTGHDDILVDISERATFSILDKETNQVTRYERKES